MKNIDNLIIFYTMDVEKLHDKSGAFPGLKIVRDSNETSFQFKISNKLAFVEVHELKLFKVDPLDDEQNLRHPIKEINKIKQYFEKFHFNKLFWTEGMLIGT